ncbi:tropomyosin-2-like isoform X2 [Clarias gariepinus]|nr:tropomyosin-2-like isoform X2 [Clarias gariepinus]
MSILQYECSEMREILLKDCEREPEVHRMLLAQNAKLKQNEELLKDSLAEAERKYDQAMSFKAQLENEKSELMSQMNTLQGSVQKMEKELSETRNECEIMKEREVYNIQKLQCEEMRESLEQCKELIKECVQERESHTVLTSECNLALTQNEESLMVNKLRETVKGLSSLLSETHKKYDEATKDSASARGVLEFVQSEAKKQARVLTQEKKTLEVALADAKNRYEDAMESNSVLEIELSNLASDLNRLEARVTETEEELSESRRRCAEVMAECEQKTQELTKLNLRLSFCKETAQTLINDYQNECQAHEALKVQYLEMKEHHDELQKATLAETEENPEQGIESSTQLDDETSVLMFQVNTLQNPVQQLQEELSETRRKCNEIMSEKEQEHEAYSILKMQYQRLQAKFEKCQGILKDLCKAIEFEEPLLP